MTNHYFHFVLSKIMKEKLKVISLKLNLTLSSVIVYIINTMIPLLDENFFSMAKKSFGTKFIGEPVADCYVVLDDKLYRKLKLIHGTKHTFSIALLIRELIKRFLMGLNKYGKENLERIMKLYFIIFVKPIIRQNKISKRGYHMLKRDSNFIEYNLFLNKNFQLLDIYFS